MSFWDIVITAALSALVVAAVVVIMVRKRKGKSCSCGCENCPMRRSCKK